MSAKYAANFNGSNYLNIANYTGNPSTFSVSHWIYLNTTQLSRAMFSNFFSSINSGWVTGISDSTNNQLKFYLGSNTLVQSGTLSNQTWYHVVMTYDGTVAKIYINGTLNNSLTSAVNYSGGVYSSNFIGTLQNSSQFFNGKIANLGYWNKALSSTEVTSLYNSATPLEFTDLSGSLLANLVSYYDFKNSSSLGSDSSANSHNYTNTGGVLQAYGPAYTNTTTYGNTILAETGLVAYYQLNETSGTAATDSKGTNNGTYSGGYTLDITGPNLTNQCVLFDGSTGYIEAPTNSVLHPTSALSLEAWIYTTGGSGANRTIAGCGNNSSPPYVDYELSLSTSNTVNANITIGSTLTTISSSATVSLNTWYHVIMTYNGTTFCLYVNGSLVASTGLTGSVANSGRPFAIARYNRNNGASLGEYFPGMIDEVALYNTVLNSTKVLNHYNTGLYNYTVSGPSGGAPSLASSNFTVTPTGSISGTITPSDNSAGGIFSPTSLTFSSSSVSQTFTYTPPTTEQIVTISFSSALSNPPSIKYVSVASVYSQTITTTPGLVNYYRLNETSGTIATDFFSGLSGTYTGTCTLNQTSKKTALGTAVLFTASSGYVAIGSSATLPTTGTYSFEIWTKVPSGLTINNNCVLMGYGSGAATNKYNFLDLNTPTQLRNSWWSNDAVWTIPDIRDNLWHYIVVTFNGTNRTAYLDGILLSAVASSGINANQTSYGIGGVGGAGNPGIYVDDAALYNVALTQTQITNHLNAISDGTQKARVSQVGVLAITQGNPKARLSQVGLLVIANTKVLAVARRNTMVRVGSRSTNLSP